MLAPSVGVLLRDRVARRSSQPARFGAGGLVLRTNLSTRPFYNERAVHLLLALAAVVVLALTAFNAIRIIALSRQNTELSSLINRDHDEAAARAKRSASVPASTRPSSRRRRTPRRWPTA